MKVRIQCQSDSKLWSASGRTALDTKLDHVAWQKTEPSYADLLYDVLNMEADAQAYPYLKTRLQVEHYAPLEY